MSCQFFDFPSANGRDQIQATVYYPYCEPKATMQIIHGFLSHQGEFSHVVDRYLAEGYVVYSDDHVGHGRTADANDTWGHYGDGGYANFYEDEHTLAQRIAQEYPDLPHFMHGFSMGTEIIRLYLARHNDDIAGVILEGVVEDMTSVMNTIDDPELAKAAEEHGHDIGWDWVMPKAFLGAASRYVGLPNPEDFGTTDPVAAAARAADYYRVENHGITIQGVREFVQISKELADPTWEGNIPEDVAFYLLSGDQDPCGNYGEGTYHLSNRLIESGHNKLMTRVYTGFRHQLTTDPSIQDAVIDTIVSFVDAVLAGTDLRLMH